ADDDLTYDSDEYDSAYDTDEYVPNSDSDSDSDDLKRVRESLATDSFREHEVSNWAVDVLSSFVVIADMKNTCKESDLIELPTIKAVFDLLLDVIEYEAKVSSEEAAEDALISAVASPTTDKRAGIWILNQYSSMSRPTLFKRMHMYCISHLARSPESSGASTDISGLHQAMNGLAERYSEMNKRALDEILEIYLKLIEQQDADPSTVLGVSEDDPRRYILHYMLRSHLECRTLFLDGSATTSKTGTEVIGSNRNWLGDAIRFEMRFGFSRLVVHASGTRSLHPLAEAIDVLFCDPSKPKRALEQPLDIGRTVGVFWLMYIVVNASSRDSKGDQQAANDDGDVEMKSTGAHTCQQWCDRFIDGCEDMLRKLVGREQEQITLHQLPKTIRNMPQPIPNGLPEVAQRSVRLYNSGPTSISSMRQSEGEQVLRSLFRVISAMGGAASSEDGVNGPATRVFGLLCNAAPVLVEIVVVRIDNQNVVKGLVRGLVEGWPLRMGGCETAGVNPQSIYALYRALQAIGECHRGVLSKNLQHVFSTLVKQVDVSPARLEHLVDLLATAAVHSKRLGPESYVREAVDGLRDVFLLKWRPLWKLCFGVHGRSPGGGWAKQMALIEALNRSVDSTWTIERVAVAECALRELVIIQEVLIALHDNDTKDVDQLTMLARALLSLVLTLARNSPGIERQSIERLVRILLLAESTINSDELNLLFSVGEGDKYALYGSIEALENDSTQSSDASKAKNDGASDLSTLLEGRLVSLYGSGASKKQEDAETVRVAEQMLWQNAVRPIPKYPRSGFQRRDQVDDSWTFVRPQPNGAKHADQKPGENRKMPRRPLIVLALLSVVRQSPASAMGVLGQLIEEYYADSMPNIPPTMVDQRLYKGRLQMQPVEMELIDDMRNNADLEQLVFALLQSEQGRESGRRIMSAVLVGLVVLWSGALLEPAKKRPKDLEFTVSIIDHVVAESECSGGIRHIAKLVPLMGGSDVARVLHVCVWRWILHRMPGAEDESHILIAHLLRRYIVSAAPLFRLFT
ncbi:hypothetical protein GGI15_004543, partial [Coemansia interrupta]